jgi:hypothetical protein
MDRSALGECLEIEDNNINDVDSLPRLSIRAQTLNLVHDQGLSRQSMTMPVEARVRQVQRRHFHVCQ